MASVILQILILTILLTDEVNCTPILRYIKQQKSWQNASDHCASLNGSLFATTTDTLYSLFGCDSNNKITYPIWTGRFKSLSAWIEIRHCFQATNIKYSRKVTYNGETITEYDCQQYCKGDTIFAQGLYGECLCNVTIFGSNSHFICNPNYPYRVYKVFDVNRDYWNIPHYYSDASSCVYTQINACHGERSFYATECRSLKNVICKSESAKKDSVSWFGAKSICNQNGSMLRSIDSFPCHVNLTWIGISRGYAYIYSENVPDPDPTVCIVYNKNASMQISSCNTTRTFVCKIDIDEENDIENDDCVIKHTETTYQSTSTERDMSSTEYSTTTTTDYLSTLTSSLTENQTTSTSYSTENQTTSTSYSTENQTTSTLYSTENQTTSTSYSTENLTTSVSYSTKNQTTTTSYSTENQTTASFSTENQTTSTSYSTQNQTSTTTDNDTVTTFTKKPSKQLPTVVVGSVIGLVVMIIIVVAVLVVVKRKKISSNKYKRTDKAEETEKPTVNTTNRSPAPFGSSNVSGSKSDVDCDPWQSFEESQTLTNAGKKLNRQSQNPMYELNSFQYDSYSVAAGLSKQNHTEKYENVNLDIYNHCNLGNSTMAASQQNVYDSPTGIYSHLNHGRITDHNEDTYDHFHGSDQDYDQFDRTIRKTENTSEYSLYQ
ncbi:unnamed protein product [Mytilus coruscus]|uniref:C-type lectin domain-containing protein n=1 Tax=Mytilus coruscus TaxID=42192 RepID=A0A6J8BWQ1_MYTCO|nr:unnamed protein product [Mytilus coruscus]